MMLRCKSVISTVYERCIFIFIFNVTDDPWSGTRISISCETPPPPLVLIIRYHNTYSTHCNILHVANLHNFTKKQELQFNNMLFITYVVCGNVLRTWTFISYVREHTLRTYVCVLCPLWEKKGGKGGKNKIINKNIKCTSRVCCILCGLMRKEAKSTACIGSKVRKRSVEVKMSYFTTITKNATCFTNKDPGPPYLVSRIT